MHKVILVLSGTIAVALFPAANRVNSAAQIPSVSACYPSDDYATDHRNNLRRLATSSDVYEQAYGKRIKVPPVSDTSAVFVVTDSATCAAAVGPHNQYVEYTTSELANGSSQRVYLIKAGTVFVASNPYIRPANTTAQVVMDSTFQHLATFLH